MTYKPLFLLMLWLTCCWCLPSAAALGDGTIKIGAILPLSGAFAPFGAQIQAGMLEASASDIQLVFEDSRFDTKTALSAYRKLTSLDHVDYLISAGGETCGVINREAQKDRLVHIAVGCNTEAFDNPDSCNFRLDVNEAIAAEQTAGWLARNHIKRLAIIGPDNVWGGVVAKFSRKAFEAAGLEITDHLAFRSEDAGDLGSLLTKVKQHAPQRLFIISSAEDFALILKQLRRLRLSTPIVSTISVENPKFLELTGAQSEGIVYLSVKENPASRSQFPAFFKRFPAGSTFAAWGYDAVQLLRAANGAKDPKGYLQALKGFAGAFNTYTFDSRGELHLQYEMRIIRNGRFEYLDQVW